MNVRNNLIKLSITATFGIVLIIPVVVFGQTQQNYQPLVGIPGVSESQLNFNTYINQLYFLSISIAALLAVIKIIIGGVKWMLTDIVTSKSDAKNDIRSALVGLVLIVSAVLILETINPQLRNLNVLEGAPAITLPTSGQQYGPPLPADFGSAQNTAPIVQTTNPDGTVTRQTSMDLILAGAQTRTVTIDGVTLDVPIIDSSKLQQYNSQQEELRNVTCASNGNPGTIEGRDPIKILVRNGTNVNPNPQSVFSRWVCI